MPRLAFEEPKGGPARQDGPQRKRDNVVVAMKAAVLALVVGIVGAGVLLVSTASGEKREAKAPEVPVIEETEVATTQTRVPNNPAAEIVVPEVRTQTAEISAPPKATTTTPPAAPPTTRPSAPDEDRFAVVGRPCDTPGARAFTERFEPVVCLRRRGGGSVWRPIRR